jgi:hypothetical protein
MAEKTEFLPFHAINEYMRPDFRLKVIRDTLSAQANLEEHLSNELNQQIKKNVNIPGFRSSDKAPALVKVVPTSKAFEKNPDLVAVILSAWAELNPELRDQIYSVLKSLNWKFFPDEDVEFSTAFISEAIKDWPIFPIKMNRRKLPGFYTHWPKGDDFEAIYKKYTELYPDSGASIDKVGLMTVWLAMRLPYQVDEEISPKDDLVSENPEP